MKLALMTAGIALGLSSGAHAQIPQDIHVDYHFCVGGNWDTGSPATGPGLIGCNVTDVSSPGLMLDLPAGFVAMVYLGQQCYGDNAAFENLVAPYLQYAGTGKIFGFYLTDEPQPNVCAPHNLQKESEYIHAKFGNGTVTFITLYNNGNLANPNYCGTLGCYNNSTTPSIYYY